MDDSSLSNESYAVMPEPNTINNVYRNQAIIALRILR